MASRAAQRRIAAEMQAAPEPRPLERGKRLPKWWGQSQSDMTYRVTSLTHDRVDLEALPGLNAKVDNAVLFVHPFRYQSWVRDCETFAVVASNMLVPIGLVGYRYMYWPMSDPFPVSEFFMRGNRDNPLRLYWNRPPWATTVAVCRVYLTEMNVDDKPQLKRLGISVGERSRDGVLLSNTNFVYPEFFVFTRSNTCAAE